MGRTCRYADKTKKEPTLDCNCTPLTYPRHRIAPTFSLALSAETSSELPVMTTVIGTLAAAATLRTSSPCSPQSPQARRAAHAQASKPVIVQ